MTFATFASGFTGGGFVGGDYVIHSEKDGCYGDCIMLWLLEISDGIPTDSCNFATKKLWVHEI